MKPTTIENITNWSDFKYFQSFGLNAIQIKAILDASSLEEAINIQVQFANEAPKYSAYQIRSKWGYKSDRIEHCFICGDPLYFEETIQGDSTTLYSQAVYFKTRGNWPSAVLDLESKDIEILICDKCLKERLDRAFVEEAKEQPKVYRRRSYNQIHGV